MWDYEKVNPKYILEKLYAQDAIQKADEGDYTLVNEL